MKDIKSIFGVHYNIVNNRRYIGVPESAEHGVGFVYRYYDYPEEEEIAPLETLELSLYDGFTIEFSQDCVVVLCPDGSIFRDEVTYNYNELEYRYSFTYNIDVTDTLGNHFTGELSGNDIDRYGTDFGIEYYSWHFDISDVTIETNSISTELVIETAKENKYSIPLDSNVALSSKTLKTVWYNDTNHSLSFGYVVTNNENGEKTDVEENIELPVYQGYDYGLVPARPLETTDDCVLHADGHWYQVFSAYTVTGTIASGAVATTQEEGDSSTKVATTEFVDKAVSTATEAITSVASAGIVTGSIASAVTATTQAAGDSSAKVATTEFVDKAVSTATEAITSVASAGTVTGTIASAVTATSQAAGDSSAKVATTEWVQNEIAELSPYDVFTIASETEEGENGLVPAPEKTQGSCVLTGNASWVDPSTFTVASAGTVTGTIASDAVATTQEEGDSSKKVATTEFVTTAVNNAVIDATGAITSVASAGTVTGTIASAVTATTQTAGDSSTKVATTEFVDKAVSTATEAITSVASAGTVTGSIASAVTATTQDISDSSTKVATTEFVKNAFSYADALTYKGVVSAAVQSSSDNLTPAANKGDVYKVVGSGYVYDDTGLSIQVEPGDMLICNTDNTTKGDLSKWDIIQNNVEVFRGATNSANGTVGLVPQPKTSDANSFLRGDGTWSVVNTTSVASAGIVTGSIASAVTATTQTAGDSSTKVATTEFVAEAVSGYLPLAGGTMSGAVTLKGEYSKVVELSGTSVEINPNEGTIFNVSVTGDTTFTLNEDFDLKGRDESDTSLVGTCLTITLHDADGYVLTWPSSINWDDDVIPTLLDDEIEVVTLLYDGTSWYGCLSEHDKTFTAGKDGLVPAPTEDDSEKFLRGDGTWAVVDTDITSVSSAGTVTGSIASSVTATTQTAGDSSTKVATTEFVANAVDNAVIYKGTISAYHDSCGGTTPVANKGDMYKVTVTDSEGYVNGVAVEDGDFLICNTDNTESSVAGFYAGDPNANYATIASNWDIIKANPSPAYSYRVSSVYNGVGVNMLQDSNKSVGYFTISGANGVTVTEGLNNFDIVVSGATSVASAGTVTTTIASAATATTQTAGDSSTKVATTEFVAKAVSDYLPLAGGTMSGAVTFRGEYSNVVDVTAAVGSGVNYAVAEIDPNQGTIFNVDINGPSKIVLKPIETVGGEENQKVGTVLTLFLNWVQGVELQWPSDINWDKNFVPTNLDDQVEVVTLVYNGTEWFGCLSESDKVFSVGKDGNVPAPTAADSDKVLKGDGTWGEFVPKSVYDAKIAELEGLIAEMERKLNIILDPEWQDTEEEEDVQLS